MRTVSSQQTTSDATTSTRNDQPVVDSANSQQPVSLIRSPPPSAPSQLTTASEDIIIRNGRPTLIILPPSLKRKFIAAYEVVVHWRKNLFDMPKGAIGKSVVREMTTLIDRWTNNTSESRFFLKSLIIMILPNLLLQKTSNSKN